MADVISHVGRWIPTSLAMPAGHSAFVVGDVHGMYHPFLAVLRRMSRLSPRMEHKSLTLLGDLVDRGSLGIQCLREAATVHETLGLPRATLLMGNHEAIMLAGLGLLDPYMDRYHMAEAKRCWLRHGGRAVITELERSSGAPLPADSPDISTALLGALGPQAATLLLQARSHHRIGNLVMCHAGMAPGTDITEWFSTAPWPIASADRSWCWIREPFLLWDQAFTDGVLVVHGHTKEIKVRNMKGTLSRPLRARHLHSRDGDRIGLDGGSYSTGMVAAAQFERNRWRFIAAGNPDMMAQARLSF